MCNYKILVVDDDKLIYLAIKLALGSKWTVDHATDGLEGLDKIAKINYDYIFVDHCMPNMNGDEMIARLPQDISSQIIKISAFNHPSDSPNIPFLKKPINMLDIESVISEYSYKK